METKPPPFKKKWLFRRFVFPKILGIIASPSWLPWSIPKILFGGIGQSFLWTESGSKRF